SLWFVEIEYKVSGGSPAGDDVRPAIAGQVAHDQIFGRHPSGIDHMLLPLPGGSVNELVHYHANGSRGIAVSKDDFVLPVAVEVRRPQSVPALETFIDHRSLPQRVALFRR